MKSRSLRLLALVALVVVASPAFAANFIVNSAAGGGDASPGDGVCEHTVGSGDCTASAAVQESNAWPEKDAIILPAGDFPADPFLQIEDATIVAGAGAASTTIFGNGADTVLYFSLHVDVTLVGVTVTGGNGWNVGGAITLSGGGRLTLIDCVIRDNQTMNVGGGVYIDAGSLWMIGTTVTNNRAGNVGGGVYIGPGSSGRIINSTISGNRAGNTGGGLANEGHTSLNNVTIAGNVCINVGAGIDNDFDNGPVLTIANSLLTGNYREGVFGGYLGADDCYGEVTTLGYNLIASDTAGCTLVGAGTGTDVIGIDPQLGPLADNGGPTPTHALVAASAAVNAGNPAVAGSGNTACAETDQRGIDRPSGVRCDIGAFELSRCGNGGVDPEEECDDGSNVDGDGCDSNCTVTRCGNGITTAGEECDDANTLDGDCCTSACTLPPIESLDSPITSDASFALRRGGKVSFKWQSDEARPRDVFGDPTTDTDVSVCVLDTTGATPALVASARVPAGASWKSTATGFSYRGSSAAPGTLERLALQGGSGLRIRAKGISPKLAPGRLPLITPVAVAVRTSTSDTIFVVGFQRAKSNSPKGFNARAR